MPTLFEQAACGVFSFVAGKPGHAQLYLWVKGYTNYRDLYDYFESGYGFSARYNIKPRIHIKYQPNVDDLGSADSARINMEYYELNNPVFAVQGDNIFDIKVKSLIDYHRKNAPP